MHFTCQDCGKTYPLAGLAYQCRCGGLFRLHKEPGEQVELSVTLGEGRTPLLEREIAGIPFHLKLDYLMPTGSFKDRGAAVLVSQLKNAGITEVVEDSSGNAGAAIAAYCAAAGIRCHIYLPECTSPGKITQIAAYGADIVRVPGTRDDTARAVREAAGQTYYASHVYNPLFFEGTKSFAEEIIAALGVPDTVFLPAGNGTLLLGAYLGFTESGQLPRLVGIQSANCAPVAAGFSGVATPPIRPTLAEGIAIAHPPRQVEMITAVRASGGEFVTVTEAEIEQAARRLARMGLFVEVTGAVALAGACRYYRSHSPGSKSSVIPLTGIGLKK